MIDYKKIENVAIREGSKFFPFVDTMVKKKKTEATLKFKNGTIRNFNISGTTISNGKKVYIIKIKQEDI